MSTDNPYASPKADLATQSKVVRYAGFWIRALASIVDSILLMLVIFPLLWVFYGNEAIDSDSMLLGSADFLISYVMPFFLYVFLWVKYGGTPGKRMLGIKIVDKNTGDFLDIGASVIRYIGYFVSTIALFIGFIWVAFQSEKRGWHDLMAGSVVVYD